MKIEIDLHAKTLRVLTADLKEKEHLHGSETTSNDSLLLRLQDFIHDLTVHTPIVTDDGEWTVFEHQALSDSRDSSFDATIGSNIAQVEQNILEATDASHTNAEKDHVKSPGVVNPRMAANVFSPNSPYTPPQALRMAQRQTHSPFTNSSRSLPDIQALSPASSQASPAQQASAFEMDIQIMFFYKSWSVVMSFPYLGYTSIGSFIYTFLTRLPSECEIERYEKDLVMTNGYEEIMVDELLQKTTLMKQIPYLQIYRMTNRLPTFWLTVKDSASHNMTNLPGCLQNVIHVALHEKAFDAFQRSQSIAREVPRSSSLFDVIPFFAREESMPTKSRSISQDTRSNISPITTESSARRMTVDPSSSREVNKRFSTSFATSPIADMSFADMLKAAEGQVTPTGTSVQPASSSSPPAKMDTTQKPSFVEDLATYLSMKEAMFQIIYNQGESSIPSTLIISRKKLVIKSLENVLLVSKNLKGNIFLLLDSKTDRVLILKEHDTELFRMTVHEKTLRTTIHKTFEGFTHPFGPLHYLEQLKSLNRTPEYNKIPFNCVGYDLSEIQPECYDFRRVVQSSLAEAVEKGSRLSILGQYARTSRLRSVKQQQDVAIMTRISVPMQGVTKLIPTTASITVETLLEIILKKFTHLIDSGNGDQLVLKFTGRHEYLHPKARLEDIEFVRFILSRYNKPIIELTLIEKKDAYVTDADLTLFDATPWMDDAEPSVSNLWSLLPCYLTSPEQNCSQTGISETLYKYSYQIYTNLHISLKIEANPPTNLVPTDYSEFVTYVALYFGEQQFAVTKTSACSPQKIFWEERVEFPNIRIRDIPSCTRIVFFLKAVLPKANTEVLVYWSQVPIVDHRRIFIKQQTTCIFPSEIAFDASTPSQLSSPSKVGLLKVALYDGDHLIVHEDYESPKSAVTEVPTVIPYPTERTEVDILRKLEVADPLYELTEDEQGLLWKYRYHIKDTPTLLSKFLRSVKWHKYEDRIEARNLAIKWKRSQLLDSVEFLNHHHRDEYVRALAVFNLEKLPCLEYQNLLLQLVQALKFEHTHDSPLARLMLRKGLERRFEIGNALFWHLKAELGCDNPVYRQRFAIILESYLHLCGDHVFELEKQVQFIQHLRIIAQKVKKSAGLFRIEQYRENLQDLNKALTQPVQNPIRPSMYISEIIVRRCRIMDSAKAPLWLVMKNHDPQGSNILVIYKLGDDLRQDVLTIQMLQVMDMLWKQSGLDLELTPYKCIAMSEDDGMIEVVENSNTLANIQKENGGVTAAFSDTSLLKWLQIESQQDEMEKIVRNFVHSLAGYCVATYVLGIGDRHNDNIMLARSGHFFRP
eukprot:TRINITY_DN6269_c0_g1_i6.p1 TRINITY_DN6269_c0_g1~~TRINITY_DN6269_c0_g1_i6.p1  ORF type:complete len:1325 (+),score=245.59 TRINITY_DN6269_c0_g1_i6:73-4047(+)